MTPGKLVCGVAFVAALVLTATQSSAAAPAPLGAQTTSPNQQEPLTNKQIREVGGKPAKLIDAPEEPNMDALYRRGIQGEMLFSGYVGVDGRIHDVKVVTSSRSVELDTIGLTLVQGSTFAPATDAAGKPIDAKVVYPVYLWKDTMSPEFARKKCAQFVIDADWYAQAFPEKKRDGYRGWLLARGMLLVSTINQKSKRPEMDFAAVYQMCKSRPDKVFMDILAGR